MYEKVTIYETCTVCDKIVEVTKAEPVVHQGKLYFTCSPTCHSRFTAYPHRYTKSPALSGRDLRDEPD